MVLLYTKHIIYTLCIIASGTHRRLGKARAERLAWKATERSRIEVEVFPRRAFRSGIEVQSQKADGSNAVAMRAEKSRLLSSRYAPCQPKCRVPTLKAVGKEVASGVPQTEVRNALGPLILTGACVVIF